LKENVIIGQLIPAGTGLKKYKDLIVVPKDIEITKKKEGVSEVVSEEKEEVKT